MSLWPWPGLELLSWSHRPQGVKVAWPVCVMYCVPLLVSAEFRWTLCCQGTCSLHPFPLALGLERMGSWVSVLGFVRVCLSDHLWETFVLRQNNDQHHNSRGPTLFLLVYSNSVTVTYSVSCCYCNRYILEPHNQALAGKRKLCSSFIYLFVCVWCV